MVFNRQYQKVHWASSVRRAVAILAAVAAAMVFAACGSSNSEASSDTLRFASHGPPIKSWDPHKDGRPASNVALFAVYDRLIGQAPSGELQPQLATEWEFKDPKTFEMTLRDDVTFHDGEKFNAKAVKANIERAKTVNDGTGPWSGPLAPIKSVEAIDATHVRFNLSEAFASLPDLLSDQAGAMISPAAFDSDLGEQPVGAGMYHLEKWTADGSATFEAYDDYWDPEVVGPQTIKMPFQLDQLRRLDMFKADEVDATFGHTTFVDDAEKAGIDVEPKAGINYWFMDLNRTQEPFDDVNVRKAINYALDQDALIKAVLAGQAEANDQPFNEESLGFSEKLGKDIYPHDVEKAKELLADSEHSDGVSFECATIAGSGGAYSQYAEVVKDQLAKAGIDMKIKLVESQSNALLVDKTVNCAIMPYGSVSPIINAEQLFAPDGHYNAGKKADDKTVKLLSALQEPQSDKELESDFEALMDYVADQALFTNLFYENWAVISNDKVSGLEFYMGGWYTEFRNIEMK